MQYEFLKRFPKRMKNVGLYAVLLIGGSQKTTWKQYGFDTMDEQINVVFAVLLYLMEQSLREDSCTMDEIGAYIDTLNTTYFQKPLSYEECRKLGDFILNVILSNEGRPMYFQGYDFEEREYRTMHISYVANRIVYLDTEVKRTSYYLTDDGYNLLLGTLEIESNMKLTIHEMIFKLHLEKQSYDKAADEIKNVFNLLRIQLQKIQEAMGRIRRNALNYSVADYEEILGENMNTIRDTRAKFLDYREMVKSRVFELEKQNINVSQLDDQDTEKLANLRVIEEYLNRAIDEHQKIFNHHLDLKALYTRELEELSQMSLIQRFSLRSELFDKVLEQPDGLERLDFFFRPLFTRDVEKAYNLNKAFEIQKTVRRRLEDDTEEMLDFDEEEWQREQAEALRRKLALYRGSLGWILETLLEKKRFTLSECKKLLRGKDELHRLIPTVEIFKEIMVELLKSRELDLPALRKERSEFIQESVEGFQLSEMLLDLTEEMSAEDSARINKIVVSRIEDGTIVLFTGVTDEQGNARSIRCSNVLFCYE